MSLFQGLEIGKRALLAHQLSLNTTGHNIANVNTPGYTRQRVEVGAAAPVESMYGPVGMGVDVTNVKHIRDLFLNGRWRQENENLGQWQARAKRLAQIEGFFNEPQDASLGAILSEFWASWHDLANKPEASETRKAVIQQAQLVTNAFHQLHGQLSQLSQSVDVDIQNRLKEINNIGSEIADLNRQVAYVELGGENANDLRDRRDLLIDQLSQYVDVNVREDDLGRTTVYLGAMAFVDETSYWPLEAQKVSSGNGTKIDIRWQGSTFEPTFFKGEMKALTAMRDEVIPDYLNKLNTLSKAIVDNVNAAHRAGYGLDGLGGINFFDPLLTDADQIVINIEVLDDPSKIAASTSGEVGDGSNALMIADVLKVNRIMSSNMETIEQYYSSMVGSIGMHVQEANAQTENYTLLVQQIENSRQSVQGVSLDEEMANLVKFQHAYAAAARVITVMDEALSTLISRTGIVGR
ncbi:MAG: flagellar hook-associated protein FlgK [candidate division Zixibacteria bacterium]|nr:flagellar hook-associated protein FlgK [candidate division Zixibacteria bacterium]